MSNPARPKIKLTLRPLDVLLEILGYLAIIVLWCLFFYFYKGLPSKIAIHFDINGKVDGYGSKLNIIVLPVITNLLFLVLTLLNRYPHKFNYLSVITIHNAEKQYQMATTMIRYLKLLIVVMFGSIFLASVQSARIEKEGMGIWILTLGLFLIVLPILAFLIKSNKEK